MIINLQKPYIKFILFVILLFSLFIFQESNFETVKQSTDIFLSSILPSIFPFILFTNMLLISNGLVFLKPILKENYYVFFCIITGFLCGYPMGAKTTSAMLNEKKISYKQAKFLLSFVNNCNPIFILSTVGLSILGNVKYGLILCISHYLSAIIISLIYLSHTIIHKSNKKSNNFKINETKILHNSIFEVLDASIKSTLSTLGNIFSCVTIFNLLFSCIKQIIIHFKLSNTAISLISSIFEVTQGIKNIVTNTNYTDSISLCLISFALGFSGFAIIFQIYSCIYKDKINVFYIIYNKLKQGILSSIITYICLKLCKNTKINLFSYEYLTQNFKLNIFSQYSYFIFCVCIIYILIFAFNSTKNRIQKK